MTGNKIRYGTLRRLCALSRLADIRIPFSQSAITEFAYQVLEDCGITHYLSRAR
jgi:hypothetical protein